MGTMDQEQGGQEVGLSVFLCLLREAVGHILYIQNGEAFLSWMRAEAPRRFPEVFAGLPEPVARALATELGWQVWNVTPLPGNDFRPRPMPRPQPADPEAPAVPGLTPELAWALVASELPLDKAADLAEQGGVPRPYLGIVARRLVAEGVPSRALALLEPLFGEAEVLDKSDMDAWDALLAAYRTLGRTEEVRAFLQRFQQRFLGSPPD